MKKLVKFILLTMIMSMVGNQVLAYDFKQTNKEVRLSIITTSMIVRRW